MPTPFHRGFRKIAMLAELDHGRPRRFLTGGASVLLLRSRFGVRAVDAAGCAGEEVDDAAWTTALEGDPLPVEIHEGAVWVCVDLCIAEQ